MDIRIISLTLLLALNFIIMPSLAIDAPINYNPIYTLYKNEATILHSGNIEGTECTNRYKTSGDYCSGNIRIYYQCDYSTEGLTWQKRSENCGNYGYLCVSGDCVPSSTHNILMKNLQQILVFLGIIVFFSYLYLRDRKKK